MDPKLDTIAALFRALADPHRLKVLQVLAQLPGTDGAWPGTLCACDLESVLGLSQPTISHHMRLLVRAELVSATRRGKWTHYALKPEGLDRARAALALLEPRR